MALTFTSTKRILEVVAPKPVKKIKIETLRNWAIKDATTQASRPENIMITAHRSFGYWMSKETIAHYFLTDNLIGLTVEGAQAIRDTYFETFLKVKASLAAESS